jgi:DNA-binding transcriptional ArsR family regulator
MKIEEVFSSRGRVRILRVLSEISELNISELARRAELNYATANVHLQVLEEAGLVTHKSFGRIRIFRLNIENPKACLIRDLMEAWDQKTLDSTRRDRI